MNGIHHSFIGDIGHFAMDGGLKDVGIGFIIFLGVNLCDGVRWEM